MGVDLVGVFDYNRVRSKEVADEMGCKWYDNPQLLLDDVEAISIAAPTTFHFDYAFEALTKGIHVFVEKPITESIGQAVMLVELSKHKQLVLQVGHIERFNEALVNANVNDPDIMLAKRTSKADGRSNDIDVVLDLMIHDLDIALSHFRTNWYIMRAVRRGDWTKVRVEFGDDRHAIFHVNRKAEVDERHTLFQFYNGSSDIQVNYHNKSNDALLDELTEFIKCIRSGSRPTVSGTDGLMALRLATEIRERIQNV